MKKFLFYLLGFIFICFILPALFTRKKQETVVHPENNEQNVIASETQEAYNYKQYGTIQLLHTKTGEVEQVELDTYLCNVISAEMPADYELEALKAQAIVARTYTIFKTQNKKHENADICDSSACCQAWISKEDRLARWEESLRDHNWNKIEEAVNSTKGKIITYQNAPINAFFHSNSGGKTEVPVNVWGGNFYPYLQTVETAGEDTYQQYASEISLSNQELLDKLKSKYSDIAIDFSNPEDIKILEYTEGERAKTVKFGNHNLSGVEVRTLLGLRSANFTITQENDNVKFSVKGYGHGVGMSQTGADAMAKQGSSAEEIIHHFYTDVEIKNVNELY